MTPDEVRSLIGICEANYRQSADPRDEMIWTATMGDLDFGTLRAAVVEWCRASPYWPRPADLRERARLIRTYEERERGKRKQLDGRQAAIESAVRTEHASKRTGADMVRHVLGRLKDAGSDPAEGQHLGAERATAVAEEAVKEWLDRTRATPAESKEIS